jgi:hypothetical protein
MQSMAGMHSCVHGKGENQNATGLCRPVALRSDVFALSKEVGYSQYCDTAEPDASYWVAAQ